VCVCVCISSPKRNEKIATVASAQTRKKEKSMAQNIVLMSQYLSFQLFLIITIIIIFNKSSRTNNNYYNFCSFFPHTCINHLINVITLL